MPQVSLPLDRTRTVEGTSSMDPPFSALCPAHKGTMYQRSSRAHSTCTWAPTVGRWTQLTSEQYRGSGRWLKFSQCCSQLPHLQLASLVPLMFLMRTVTVPPNSARTPNAVLAEGRPSHLVQGADY